MAAQSKPREIRLRGQFPSEEIISLFPIIRKLAVEQNADIQIVISFPESPAQGAYITRPYSCGGPSVFVSLVAPAEQGTLLQQVATELEKQFVTS